MIVSHTSNFIWIKTRKTASSSIELALGQLCSEYDFVGAFRDNETRNLQDRLDIPRTRDFLGGIGMHGSVSDARQFLEKDIATYFKFTTERNPFDKVVSLYFYYTKMFREKMPSFEDWILNMPRKIKGIKNPSWTVCYNWPLYTENDEVMMDYIVLYEHLEEELEYVGEVIGSEIKPYRMNTSHRPNNKRDYREFYNKKTRKAVEDYFKKEIEYFGYSF